MFTGIIEAVGTLVHFERRGSAARLLVAAPELAVGVEIGDSVAVNGACLTVTELSGERIGFDAVRETLERSALSDLAAGMRVNLERAMRAGARLDGHIVQGHVDGVGRVGRLEQRGDDVQLYVAVEPDFADLLVEKGSVAIDGVSLTVVGVEPTGFDVALIPYTLKHTTLGERSASDRLNLEADVLGKYVKRYLERILPAAGKRAGEA